jgi:hypothetical protein
VSDSVEFLVHSASIEALGESLSNWGGKDGSIVVVSHDRAFCESVGFTHVGTVMDGGVVIEERGLEDRDWARYDIAGSASGGCEDAAPTAELTAEEKAEQERKRKLAFNAPKRMKKIEDMIAKAEAKVAEYDEQMMKFGSDAEKLMEITKKKKKEEDGVAKLMEEWESLEVVLSEMSAA